MSMKDITITSLETIKAYELNTGNYLFTLDELQNATIAQSQEKTDITGKAGRKLSSLKRNKAVTVSGTNGFISGGLLEIQTGNKFNESGDTTIVWTDYVTMKKISDSELGDAYTGTIEYKAEGETGSEIIGVWLHDENGGRGKMFTQSAVVGKDTFTYNPNTKTITFSMAATEIKDGLEVIVEYNRKVTGYTLDNISDNYSGKCTLVIDALGEDKCANIYRVQIKVFKADFSGEFSLEMGGDQTVHAFEAEALAGACGAGGSFFSYTVFGEQENNAA